MIMVGVVKPEGFTATNIKQFHARSMPESLRLHACYGNEA